MDERSELKTLFNGITTNQRVSETMQQTARNLRRGMTEDESILWRYLRAGRLDGFHFRRQQVIGKYVVDFYCDAASLVVELDGRIHDQLVERDAERDADLNARGLLVLRIKNEDAEHNLHNVLDLIAEICRVRTNQ